jgi:hypothetical protein
MMSENHKNSGNKNAQTGEEPANAHIHMRVTAKEKSAWVKNAQKEGKKLSQWIRDRLT